MAIKGKKRSKNRKKVSKRVLHRKKYHKRKNTYKKRKRTYKKNTYKKRNQQRGGANRLARRFQRARGADYFPSLNWVEMKYGLSKRRKMLDEGSKDRLRTCLNRSHERIKRVTRSVSKTGYLYTTRDSLLSHQTYFEKTEEYRGLINSLPVDQVTG